MAHANEAAHENEAFVDPDVGHGIYVTPDPDQREIYDRDRTYEEVNEAEVGTLRRARQDDAVNMMPPVVPYGRLGPSAAIYVDGAAANVNAESTA